MFGSTREKIWQTRRTHPQFLDQSGPRSVGTVPLAADFLKLTLKGSHDISLSCLLTASLRIRTIQSHNGLANNKRSCAIGKISSETMGNTCGPC